jgi:hypothetical protein
MRNKYHVTRRQDGQWQGKRVGAERASVVRRTKADAQQATINIAKNVAPASVYIHGIKGRIQEERTYPRSADPRKTKG